MTRFAHLSGGLTSLGKTIRLGDPLVRKRVRQQVSVFLISTGVSLVLLTASAYRWMHQEQQRLMSRQSLVTEISAVSGAPQDVTLLSIPKINLEAAILESTTRKSLLLAPGHVEKTAWPGEGGNSVIAGHRDTFFRRLNELQNGDDVVVTRALSWLLHCSSPLPAIHPRGSQSRERHTPCRLFRRGRPHSSYSVRL